MSSGRLRHIHLPSSSALGIYTPYAVASTIQDHFRRQLLAAKDTSNTISPPLPPTVLSFTPTPTFTLGRRQDGALLSENDIARLRAPLTIPRSNLRFSQPRIFHPELVESTRGGLTTYHGPGQVVIWPILDLKSPLHTKYTVRSYSAALESVTIQTLERLDVRGFTDLEAPGVWIRRRPDAESQYQSGNETPADGARKIAALGVHLRRHVSAYGVAINLDMPVTQPAEQARSMTELLPKRKLGEESLIRWALAGSEKNNPWLRFIPCGLEGKGVTCVRRETTLQNDPMLDPRDVAMDWARHFAKVLGQDTKVELASNRETDELLRLAQKDLPGHADVDSYLENVVRDS